MFSLLKYDIQTQIYAIKDLPETKVVYVEKSSFFANVDVISDKYENSLINGFITFIYTDENTKPKHHNIKFNIENEDGKLHEITL